jgi:hypothetical protein
MTLAIKRYWFEHVAVILAAALIVTSVSAFKKCTSAQVQDFNQGLQTAIQDVAQLMPIASSVVSLVLAFSVTNGAPSPYAAEVNKVSTSVNAGLEQISKLLAGITQANAQTVIQEIQAINNQIQQQFPEFLTVAHVVNQDTIQKVTALARVISSVLTQVLNWLRSQFNLAAGRVSAVTSLPTPAHVQDEVNKLLR